MFLSKGRGSAEKGCLLTAPACNRVSYSSYTGFITPMPKLMTVWPYWLVTGTIRSAPKASPYRTRVFTTLAMVSPWAPSSSACCAFVRIMVNISFS